MEADNAQRGGIRQALPELGRRRTGRDRADQRGDNLLGVVGEQPPAETGDVVERAVARRAFGEEFRQVLFDRGRERGEVVRVPPLPCFFRARRARSLRDERREQHTG